MTLQVLFVIPGDGQGSSMIFVRRQAEALARENVEATLFYLGSRTSPRRLLGEVRRFRAELARVKPLAIHAHFGTVTGLFCALFSGLLPLVITYRGSDLNPPPPSYRWPGKMRAWCGILFSHLAALRARRIICVSRQLRGRLWWKRGAISILPSGVDCELFRPESRSQVRARLDWSDEETVILFHAGHDAHVKRWALARAAFEKAQRLHPRLRLEILDGEVPPAQVPSLMNAADCLLLTSAWEGSPTVVQEALACDLPIVSVPVGDVAERLKNVRDSTISLPHPEVLGRALVRLINPPRRSNGSHKTVDFCSRNVARQMHQIYREVVEA